VTLRGSFRERVALPPVRLDRRDGRGRLSQVRGSPLPSPGTDDAPRGRPGSPPATATGGRPHAQLPGRGGPRRRERPTVAPVVGRRRAAILGALTVVAVWIVATGGPFGRTQTPADSGTATGRTVTESRYPADPFVGLPPEGAVPSTTETGELIADYQHVGIGWVYLYADGRVLWSFLGPT
jgi:hypothetical protein